MTADGEDEDRPADLNLTTPNEMVVSVGHITAAGRMPCLARRGPGRWPRDQVASCRDARWRDRC